MPTPRERSPSAATSPSLRFSSSSPLKKKARQSNRIGDRSTSDVVVRIRTHEGRDCWFYCHSEVLVEKSKYFAERLSDDWPTCQILDSRYCVEVYCEELEFNFHVIALRLLYVAEPQSWHGVRNALGILQVAVHLGCQRMARDCMDYLEAVPWEEAEEEEMLRTVPCLGPEYQQILARLFPIEPESLVDIFVSTIRFAISLPSPEMKDLKISAQDQLEYMLTEDDDAPLLPLDNKILRSEVKRCVKDLMTRFSGCVESLTSTSQDMDCDEDKIKEFQSLLSDVSWICQILTKMEMMKELAYYWVEASQNIHKAIEQLAANGNVLEIRLKTVEVVSKVLDSIGLGHAIITTAKRLNLLEIWLPFVQRTKHLVDQADSDGEEVSPVKIVGEIWQSLESGIVSLVLTLPSTNQAQILAEWLKSEYVRYPDLTEAFEVWCFRSKVAKRRLAFLGCSSIGTDSSDQPR